MENKLGEDLPQEMIDELLRTSPLEFDFPAFSSDYIVFDGNPSPAPEAVEVFHTAHDGRFEAYEGVDVGGGGGGDVTEMQALDPNTLMPVMAEEEMTLALLGAVDDQHGGLTFAVLEEVEEEVVEFPQSTTVVESPTVVQEEEEEGEDDEEGGEEEEEEEDDDEDWAEKNLPPPPPPSSSSRKRPSRTRRDPSEPPRKRGRKPLYPPGTPRPSRRRPRKVKLYEQEAFEDPEAERKRVNALNAKLHRQKKKEEKEQLEEQLKEVRHERDLLKAQLEEMRQREQKLIKELESQQQQRENSSRRVVASQTLNVC